MPLAFHIFHRNFAPRRHHDGWWSMAVRRSISISNHGEDEAETRSIIKYSYNTVVLIIIILCTSSLAPPRCVPHCRFGDTLSICHRSLTAEFQPKYAGNWHQNEAILLLWWIETILFAEGLSIELKWVTRGWLLTFAIIGLRRIQVMSLVHTDVSFW
jgi:hypothetical protein